MADSEIIPYQGAAHARREFYRLSANEEQERERERTQQQQHQQETTCCSSKGGFGFSDFYFG
jgi:hypothetical protein